MFQDIKLSGLAVHRTIPVALHLRTLPEIPQNHQQLLHPSPHLVGPVTALFLLIYLDVRIGFEDLQIDMEIGSCPSLLEENIRRLLFNFPLKSYKFILSFSFNMFQCYFLGLSAAHGLEWYLISHWIHLFQLCI